MKKILISLFVILSGIFLIIGCSSSTGVNGTGKLSIQLTDGPLNVDNVSAVMVKFKEIRFNYAGDNLPYVTFKEYGENQGIFNLMELQDGFTTEIGTRELDPGVYSHTRIILDPDYNHHIIINGVHKDLELTSSNEGGYFPTGHIELAGSFHIEGGIETKLILDFDVRKSVVDKSGSYKLHPAMRLIEEDVTGALDVQLNHVPESVDHVIGYLYTEGSFDESTETGNDFANSITSDNPDGGNLLEFDYIEEGSYTLVVVTYDADNNILNVYTKNVSIINGVTNDDVNFDFNNY